MSREIGSLTRNQSGRVLSARWPFPAETVEQVKLMRASGRKEQNENASLWLNEKASLRLNEDAGPRLNEDGSLLSDEGERHASVSRD